jgi:hypothetical protein
MFNLGSRPNTKATKHYQSEHGDALTSLTETTTWLPHGYELITREDIFSRGMLIMRQGSHVNMSMLPKLMRHGATPQQFVLRQIPLTDEMEIMDEQPTSAVPLASPGMTVPDGLRGPNLPVGLGLPATNVPHQQDSGLMLGSESNPDMVIVDPNQHSLRKTMDTLALAGVGMNHLHCTPQSDQLIAWVRKFKPSVLVLDEAAHPLTSMLPKINALRRTFGIEHVVLTVSTVPEASISDQYAINRDSLLKTIAAKNVDIVTKPINRLAFSNVVAQYKAKTRVSYQLEQLANEWGND